MRVYVWMCMHIYVGTCTREYMCVSVKNMVLVYASYMFALHFKSIVISRYESKTVINYHKASNNKPQTYTYIHTYTALRQEHPKTNHNIVTQLSNQQTNIRYSYIALSIAQKQKQQQKHVPTPKSKHSESINEHVKGPVVILLHFLRE